MIIRGIERKPIFKDDTDRDDFLDRLGSNLLAAETPCYAWALMGNHAHLLLRTGHVPLATLMRRQLTAYAMAFNRRYRRHGQLFQNRYKSILCQEDAYLLELTRYIHLNPLRGRVVADLEALDHYPYCGHAALMGRQVVAWQACDEMLGLFDSRVSTARRRYRAFVQQGITAGARPDLVGGGLVRSAGGWKAVRDSLRGPSRVKGDERILGDSDFVLTVLNKSDESLDRRQRLWAKGVDVDKLAGHIAGLFKLAPTQLFTPGRYPKVVRARSLLCYWAVRELGLTTTKMAEQMGLTQPAVSIAVKRGEKIAAQMGIDLISLFD